MFKIGFIDYFFDNWHTNFFPGFLREVIQSKNYDAEITAAYAFHESPTELKNAQWCEKMNVKQCTSVTELIESVDGIMVMAADNSQWKEEVATEALKSGKPVFVDKTFAPDLATGKKFFALAKQYNTPVFSSSAQRYCESILDYLAREKGNTRFMSTVGPHDLSNYAVHQFEPIVAIMGIGVKRVKAFAVGEKVTQLILDYGDGRQASFTQTPNPWAEFNFMVSDGEKGERLDSSDFYLNTMREIMEFFRTGKPPVPEEETLEILALIDAAKAARQKPDQWMEVNV